MDRSFLNGLITSIIVFTSTSVVYLLISDPTSINNENNDEFFTADDKVENIKNNLSSNEIPDYQPRSFPFDADDFNRNVRSTGLPLDGIPSIDDPVYINKSEADLNLLKDSDIVFGLIFENMIIAYPQKILVWHEIVNDIISNRHISLTYCPLTGSAVGFHGNLSHRTSLEFGVSGNLVNSNLVMYDRLTLSGWSQIYSRGVDGLGIGAPLDRIQMYWTTWGKWKIEFPSTVVLSQETGYLRDYNYDPYGQSYYESGRPMFSIMTYDDVLAYKEVIIGIEKFGNAMAIQKTVLQDKKVINFELGNLSLVAFYDESIDNARIYNRNFKNETLTFSYENMNFIDSNNNLWSKLGVSEFNQLQNGPVYMDAMWFAWYSFFPTTQLIY